MQKQLNKISDKMLDSILFNETLSDFKRLNKALIVGVSDEKLREMWQGLRAMWGAF